MTKDIFSIKRNRYYITLFFLGVFAGNYDNDQEVEEAKHNILDY
jgi:hypothetical protein